jgi:hypothetical protein
MQIGGFEMSGNPAEWAAFLRQQLAAEKKKSAILGILIVVLIVVIGRSWLSDAEPATAAAATHAATTLHPRDSAASKARPTLERSKGPRPPSHGVRPRRKAEATTPRAQRAPAGVGRVVCVDDMPRTLVRNPFNAPSWPVFMPSAAQTWFSGGGAVGSEAADSGQRFWTKIGALIGNYQKTRQQQVDQLAKELEELELQSTMTGTAPLAYISGQLVREGDAIRGFSVVRIEDRRVLVSKGGLALELAMP